MWRALTSLLGRVLSSGGLSAIWSVIRLGLAPCSLVRMAVSRPVQRAFPGFVTGARLVLILYAGTLLGLAWWAPWALRPLALLIGLTWLALAWRARPARGRRRGLPPGSLAILPPASLLDHWFYRRAAAQYGPVFKTSHFGRPMACVVGLGRGTALLRAGREALISRPFPFSRFIPGGFIRHMTPDTHARYHALFRAAIAPDVVDDSEPIIAGCAEMALRRFAAASARAGAAGVAPTPHLEGLVFHVFARLFFGIAPDSPDAEGLRALYRMIDFRNLAGASDREIEEALKAITEVIRRQRSLAGMAERGGEPPPRAFLFELEREAPGALDDMTAVRNLIYIMHTGGNDVQGLLHWVLKILGEHPDWMLRLRRELATGNPAARDQDSLATRIVLECLRLEQSEHVFRTAAADIHFGGFLVPKRWQVRVCVQESHRDPAVFADPDRFDPDRFLGRRYTRAEYSPFGLPGKSCLGDHVTRAVARLFVTALAGYDCTVVSDGPPELTSFQHWGPNPAFRVTLAPRTELDPVR